MRRIDEVAVQEFGIDLLQMMENAGIQPVPLEKGEDLIQSEGLLIDALIGYSLRGAPRDVASRLIEGIGRSGNPVLSLDLPSGTDATTGEIHGAVVEPRIK